MKAGLIGEWRRRGKRKREWVVMEEDEGQELALGFVVLVGDVVGVFDWSSVVDCVAVSVGAADRSGDATSWMAGTRLCARTRQNLFCFGPFAGELSGLVQVLIFGLK